ncbi:MAG: hypothetical protein HY918_02055 [Candidatus Doudnabacteria bacterium]|nr:hypothetical protein [Candidatus Doudnabacteria bacterium]
MDNEQIPGDKPQADNAGFVKKAVETPIFDSALRQKINSSPAETGGWSGFYRSNKYYFLAIIVGSITIAVLAYFAFKKPAAVVPKEANVAINISVPDTVPSGSEAIYNITVQNNDSQKLVNAELELVYPEGITYVSSVPEAEGITGTRFVVPDLVPGQNAALIIKTKLSGSVNENKTLDVKLHYRLGNFNSDFVKDQTVTVRTVAAEVLVELQGPKDANNAQLIVYTVKYQNNSENDISNARIKLTYPDGYAFASGNPAPDIGSDTWNIGTLAKGASGQIQIQGSFNSVNSGESKTATADFLVLDSNGQPQIQNSSTFTTAIANLPLLVTQEIQPNNNSIIKPGSTVTFNIRYQNNASTAATGVNVVVTLDSKVLNLASLKAESGQINNNTIVWNAANVPNLENLAPNESGQLSFSVQVNSPAVKDSSKNLTVVSNIKIKSNEYENFFPGGTLTLKVSSPSSISSDLSFVSGQLPPQVGKTSIYKVKLSLLNSTNDYSNGVLTAFLPLGPGAMVSGSVTPGEANNVQYDSSTGKLTWNVGALPANTGRFSQPKSLEFQIKLAPAAAQASSAPTLVKTINYTATDTFTGENISLSTDNITTNDLSGSDNYGKGIVQQ